MLRIYRLSPSFFSVLEQQTKFASEDLRPRILLFSLGPVQDFIAAARSTRDLWSGSYLLSHLTSSALGTIAQDVGPDQVIFPNLLDQPLIDHRLCGAIFDHVKFAGNPASESLGLTADDASLQRLLTPSLPNRFLALLPARMPHDDSTVEDYAKTLTENLKDLLSDIATTVADRIENSPAPFLSFDREAFNYQSARLLEIHWQALPLPDSLAELVGRPDSLDTLLPPDDESCHHQPRKAVQAVIDMANNIPDGHRDSRYFSGDQLNQASLGSDILIYPDESGALAGRHGSGMSRLLPLRPLIGYASERAPASIAHLPGPMHAHHLRAGLPALRGHGGLFQRPSAGVLPCRR